MKTLKENLPVLLNILITACILAVFRTYGTLVWWWVSLVRHAGADLSKEGFLQKADGLHILSIVLALLNAASAYELLRDRKCSRSLAMAALGFAALALAVCTLVSV